LQSTIGEPVGNRRTRNGHSTIDWRVLCEHVASHATLALSPLHGIHHWANVIRTAGVLGSHLPGINSRVTALFGLIHDCCRWNEGSDREHGSRAAAFARSLQGRYFHLDDRELVLLTEACAGHSDGRITDDLTVGACWDADRINLVRLGYAPVERFMSLDPTVSMSPAIISWVDGINKDSAFATIDSLAHICETHEGIHNQMGPTACQTP
jgi:uncharacterized protein